MIIKSLARKRPGFHQLANYIGRDIGGNSGADFTRNLYDVSGPRQIAVAFEENYVLLPKRKNGNALYHEVIVLPPQPGLSKQHQAQILQHIAERYCELRAPDNLVYGHIHLDTDNSHIHLMISANAARSSTRTRLSRAKFAEIQAELERDTRVRFPEITDRQIYDRSPDTPRRSAPVREDAMNRNNPKQTRKAVLKQQIQERLQRCKSADELQQQFAAIDLELYQRGKTLGVRDMTSGARHRLSTLGLDALVRARLKNRQRVPAPKQLEPLQTEPVLDPRAAELLRLRQSYRDRAERILRDFDIER